MKLLVNGDSFTYGDELDDITQSWPYLLDIKNVINCAGAGYSNDAILRTTIDAFNTQKNITHAIIAWTTPDRIEISNKHLTPNSTKKYGNICDIIFSDWDSSWAYSKFLTQVTLLENYFINQKIKYFFCKNI